MRRTNFRCWATRERELYRKRGFGAWVRRGCTGTTYGEEGTNEFFEAAVLLGWWEFAIHLTWKGHPDA